MDLNRKMVLAVEAGLRTSFSDYLDGVSQAGNPNGNDWYAFGGAALFIRFGDRDYDQDGIPDIEDDCPEIPGTVNSAGCPDSDEDGIIDKYDHCPQSPGPANMKGCPDSDDDGVPDGRDRCPYDPGQRRFKGCPDSDNDNVIDKEDECPDTPGEPELAGCPDSDHDGVADAKDLCPNEHGLGSADGCPDFDKDGVPDALDLCPEKAGLEKFEGCPDSDGDGIDDVRDKCPTIPGSNLAEGCPEITATDQAVLEAAMRDVRFETGSARLLPISHDILNQIGEIMKRYPGYHLEITGYTDNVGNAFANQQLSEDRARACYEYLIARGVPAERMSYQGLGPTNPIASNRTIRGRMLNRRVEFHLHTRRD